MNNQVFTTEQVRYFNNHIREWILKNGSAKLLEDFDKTIKVFLDPNAVREESTFFMILVGAVTVWCFCWGIAGIIWSVSQLV